MHDFLTPVVETEPRPDAFDREKTLYLRSYLLMRAMVGAIGVVLPFLLVLGDRLLFSGKPFPRDSLSVYYYSGVRDLFVGTLSATAIFLVTYKVIERNLDNTLSIVAGLAALSVAMFPTGRPTKDVALSPLQDRLGEGFVQAIHFGAAGVFIGSLAFLCVCFGIREGKRPAKPKHRSPAFWRGYHWGCAGVIGLALAVHRRGRAGGWTEEGVAHRRSFSVWAFGASWLMKGLELDILRGTRRAGDG